MAVNMKIVNGVQEESCSPVSSAVRFDEHQVKSEAEKALARENCGAAAASDLSTKANVSTMNKIAGMVAPGYSKTSTYAEGDLVVYQSELYAAKADIGTAEEWTAAHWEKTTLAAVIAAMAAEETTPAAEGD